FLVDFNNHDMKFLRDLKLLSDIWYKRYLLSQTNETDRCVSEIIDEEQEQEDQNQHKFHSAIDEDFDLDAYNELFKTKELQSNINDFHKQQDIKNDQTHVIEQFYPYASILKPQLLLPYLSDNQKRLFMELDFSEKQNIEDYNKQDQRENVTQQMNKYSDIIEKEFKIQQIIEQSSSEKRLSQIRTLSQTSKKDQIRIIGDSKV
ncbi:unnamed protein product, partial [Rotaria sp. Silwood1]